MEWIPLPIGVKNLIEHADLSVRQEIEEQDYEAALRQQ